MPFLPDCAAIRRRVDGTLCSTSRLCSRHRPGLRYPQALCVTVVIYYNLSYNVGCFVTACNSTTIRAALRLIDRGGGARAGILQDARPWDDWLQKEYRSLEVAIPRLEKNGRLPIGLDRPVAFSPVSVLRRCGCGILRLQFLQGLSGRQVFTRESGEVGCVTKGGRAEVRPGDRCPVRRRRGVAASTGVAFSGPQ